MVRETRFTRNFLLLLSAFLCGCSSLLYYPRIQKQKFYDPSQVKLQHEEVEFMDKEGTRLHGWWFPAKTKESKGTVVFFHGNAENVTTHFLSLSFLPENGYNYFIFDYPGYGVSEGDPSPRTTVLSGVAALEWAAKKDPRPLIVYAQSLGGNIGFRSVLETKDHVSYKALVLSETFLSYRSIARQKASESWITWIFQPLVWLSFSDAYAPKDIEKRAPIPLLVIAGQQDQVIPPKNSEEIFEKSPEPKQIWRVEKGVHGDLFWKHDQIYRKKFVEYLDQI